MYPSFVKEGHHTVNVWVGTQVEWSEPMMAT
jgi:hypothetical protein